MTDKREDDKCRIMFDRARLRQAECREHFCQLLARAPPIPDEVPVDDHDLLLTTFWRHCLPAVPMWNRTQILGRHLGKLFLARAIRGWSNVDTAEVSARIRRLMGKRAD